MYIRKPHFSLIDCFIALLMICIWGSNYAIAKLGLQDIPPFAFMALRFALTAIILAPFISFSTKEIKEIFIYAVLIGLIHFGGIFSALSIGDAATVIIVSQLNVPLSLVLALFLLNEKMRWMQVIGIIVAIFGVAIFTGNPSFDGGIMSVTYALIGAAAWSAGTLWMKKKISVSHVAINFWMSIFSVPMLIVASLAIGESPVSAIRNITLLASVAILFQAVFIVIIGYGIWNYLVQKHDVKNIASLTLLVPISGLFFAWVLLGEELSKADMIGGSITMLGVSFIMLPHSWLVRSKSQ